MVKKALANFKYNTGICWEGQTTYTKHFPAYKAAIRTRSKILMFIGPCIIAIVDEWKTNLMSLAISFHLLCAQHVSDINISIFRSLRLC